MYHVKAAKVAVGRSREGAWIEMSLMPRCLARLRGRSREGAWIEIMRLVIFCSSLNGDRESVV